MRTELVRLQQLSCKQVSIFSVITVASGLFMAGFYTITQTSCPMNAVGLACPGCGCTRAGRLIMAEGPVVAFSNQPTATLILFTLALGCFAFLIPKVITFINTAGHLLVVLMVLGCINMFWQISQGS